jgi:glycosyltransferase involved in cell wall biosynthesis
MTQLLEPGTAVRADQAQSLAQASRLRGARPIQWEKASRRLRILEVCNEFPPTVGGSETHNVSEVDFLSRRGHDVVVLVARDRTAFETQRYDERTRRLLARQQWTWSGPHPVPVYETVDAGRRSLFDLARWYRRLSRRHGGFDVVVVHRAHWLPAFVFARRRVLTLHYMELACPKHMDAPLCAMQPDGRCECFRERSAWRNLKWWLRRRVSGYLADAIVTKYANIETKLIAAGLPAAKIHRVPNWVDASAFGGRRRRWPSMPEWFADWAGAPGKTFVSLGRLHPDHGVGLAVEAFVAAARNEHDIKLMIVGDGPEGPALRRCVAEGGMSDRVFFVGRVDREHVPAALSWADVGLATSSLDNFGWRLLELMAAGLPIVATDAGDTRRVVADGEHGWLTPLDAGAIACAIRDAAADPNALAMGAAARERIIQEFSPLNLLRYERVLYSETERQWESATGPAF